MHILAYFHKVSGLMRKYDTSWMDEADKRTLSEAYISLTDAFNGIEKIILPILNEGTDLRTYVARPYICLALSSYCTTLYNECDYLINTYSYPQRDGFDEFIVYLKQLRNLCAHRYGSTMNTKDFLPSVAFCILPMKESIRSMLYDILHKADTPDKKSLYKRVRLFNRRSMY